MKMEKVTVVSLIKSLELDGLLTKNGFQIVERNPDYVITLGGDGTVLFSERKFPQVPKLIIKRSRICRKCDYAFSEVDKVLKKIKQGKYMIVS